MVRVGNHEDSGLVVHLKGELAPCRDLRVKVRRGLLVVVKHRGHEDLDVLLVDDLDLVVLSPQVLPHEIGPHLPVAGLGVGGRFHHNRLLLLSSIDLRPVLFQVGPFVRKELDFGLERII